MGNKVGSLIDLVMAGGGVVHERGSTSAAAKVSVSAVAEVEQTLDDAYGNETPFTSFFIRVGLESICSSNGKCQVGVEGSFVGVPGMLGTFASVNVGADYGTSDHHTRVFLGGELAVLDIVSPAVEMWSLEARVTMDTADRSLGFGLFLNVGGSIKTAVSHH